MGNLTPLASVILNTMKKPDYKQKMDKFHSQIQRTRAFATGDSEAMFSYVPIDSWESVGNFKRKTKGKRDIVKKILQAYLDGIAGLPVHRSVPNYPEYNVSFLEKNLDLHKLQTKTEVGGTVAVRPYINVNGEVSYEMFEAWQLCPLVQGEELVALGVTYKSGESAITEIWTPYEYTIVKDNAPIISDINPYGTIPFSIFRAGLNDGDWFGVSDLSSAVLNNIAVLKMLTDLQDLAKNQSYSIPVYKGPVPQEKDKATGEMVPLTELKLGPDRLLTIPEGSDFFTVTPEASIKEIQEAVESLAQATFKDACVDSVVKTSTAQSGYALQVLRAPYLSKMNTKREIFKKADQRLMELAALILEVGMTGPGVLSSDFKASTIFDSTVLTPDDPQSRNLRIEADLKQGVMSRIDVIMERYHVSREEAVKIAERVDEDNKLGASPSSPTVSFNELTLGAQRLGSLGDADGFNLAREEAFKQVGREIPPVDEVVRPAADAA